MYIVEVLEGAKRPQQSFSFCPFVSPSVCCYHCKLAGASCFCSSEHLLFDLFTAPSLVFYVFERNYLCTFKKSSLFNDIENIEIEKSFYLNETAIILLCITEKIVFHSFLCFTFVTSLAYIYFCPLIFIFTILKSHPRVKSLFIRHFEAVILKICGRRKVKISEYFWIKMYIKIVYRKNVGQGQGWQIRHVDKKR